MKRFLVADDHPLFREAIIGALQGRFSDLIVAEADSITSMMIELKASPEFDLVLLDLTMPGGDLFNGLQVLKDNYPDMPVIVVSATENVEVIAQAMSFGASGFVPKSTPTSDIVEALLAVLDGNTWVPEAIREQLQEVDENVTEMVRQFKELTPKQMQVLRFVRAGMMNKQIAHEMNVTEATVKAHISAILKKLNINTRTQAVLLMDKLQIS